MGVKGFRWLFLLLVLLLLLPAAAGCSRKQAQPPAAPPGPTAPTTPGNEPSAPVVQPPPGSAACPLDGEMVDPSLISRRPLAVMIDNAPLARPQSGLEAAEMVYEILAEGGITRFMAFYLQNEPEEVGPVRSARHYFLRLTPDVNGIYVHAGGSPRAMDELKKFKIAELDDLRGSGKMWRNKTRKAPHNLYASVPLMREDARARKLDKEAVPPALFQFEPKLSPAGKAVKDIKIHYPGGYKVTYEYNAPFSQYLRFIGTEAHLDSASRTQLRARNVIVMFAKHEDVPNDDKDRLDVKVVGSGQALIFTGGTMQEGSWSKASVQEAIRFTGADGKPVTLLPGQTWIQVMPEGSLVEVN